MQSSILVVILLPAIDSTCRSSASYSIGAFLAHLMMFFFSNFDSLWGHGRLIRASRYETHAPGGPTFAVMLISKDLSFHRLGKILWTKADNGHPWSSCCGAIFLARGDIEANDAANWAGHSTANCRLDRLVLSHTSTDLSTRWRSPLHQL